MCLSQRHNTVKPVRLEPVAPLSQVKHSTTEPLCSSCELHVLKNIVFLSLKIDFILANSTYPDKMLQYVAFHLGIHCLPKYPFRGFES